MCRSPGCHHRSGPPRTSRRPGPPCRSGRPGRSWTPAGESARSHPDRVAVVDADTRLTYRELWARALRCAGALRASEVRPGDRVAVLLPNTADFLYAYYGALADGATAVPVHGLLVADGVAYVLRHSGSSVLVSGGPLWPVAE
ncbi:AMP-binding protein [Streptomyces sp. NPDC002476]|uniref:AMP-binding protein n=1 Tax=Streptomyces sp. NPDC002476 TaxID=3364648 RepID=UPI0036CAA85C